MVWYGWHSGPNLKYNRRGELPIRSPCVHKTNTLLRSMIDSAKPIMWNAEPNMFKRNDTDNNGNDHKCFLDLERTMCAPAFKISKLWWRADLPCFLPLSHCRNVQLIREGHGGSLGWFPCFVHLGSFLQACISQELQSKVAWMMQYSAF